VIVTVGTVAPASWQAVHVVGFPEYPETPPERADASCGKAALKKKNAAMIKGTDACFVNNNDNFVFMVIIPSPLVLERLVNVSHHVNKRRYYTREIFSSNVREITTLSGDDSGGT
jgi:hypothetical protein